MAISCFSPTFHCVTRKNHCGSGVCFMQVMKSTIGADVVVVTWAKRQFDESETSV